MSKCTHLAQNSPGTPHWQVHSVCEDCYNIALDWIDNLIGHCDDAPTPCRGGAYEHSNREDCLLPKAEQFLKEEGWK